MYRWHGPAKEIFAFVTLAFWLCGAVAGGETPRVVGDAAVRVRLEAPDRLAKSVLGLFDRARAPHPAAALAAWKKATRDPDQLGKPLQAVIAFMNPEMVREWSALNRAEFVVAFDPETRMPVWHFVAPAEDGVLAAAITALHLSGGEIEPPLGRGELSVERLGPPGSALAARLERGTVIAGTRQELERAVRRVHDGTGLARRGPGQFEAESRSDIVFHIDPSQIDPVGPYGLWLLRMVEASRGLGCRAIDGTLAVEDDLLALRIDTRLSPDGRPGRIGKIGPPVERSWLNWVPAKDAIALVSVAFSPDPMSWDDVFGLADRIERADPARAGVSPLRMRLNLLAVARGIRLEADLLPHVRGLTLAALTDPGDSAHVGRVLLALHMDGPEVAERIVQVVVPRIAGEPASRKTVQGRDTPPTRLAGRSLKSTRRESTVLIGWGAGVLESCLESAARPERSAATVLGLTWDRPGQKPPDRVGAFWPGRLALPIRGLDSETAVRRCLAEGPPVAWSGWTATDQARDIISWPDLRATVTRFLDSIPLEPAARP